jgi:Zn-dependent protease with chaperone function
MQFIVNQMITNLGKKDYFITVIPTYYPIARASGLSGEEHNLLTFGTIYIHEPSMLSYTDEEVTFILAHELSHIIGNHSINKIMWNVIEQLSVLGISVFSKTSYDTSKTIVEIVRLMITLLSPNLLSPDATQLRDDEYNADYSAVQITKDPNSAFTCLQKLSGGNLAKPSHTWELFDVEVPAMSFNERIIKLRENLNRR